MPFMFSLMRLEMSTGPPFSNSMPWHTRTAGPSRYAVPRGATRCRAVPRGAARCCAVLCGAVRCRAVLRGAVRCCAVLRGAVRCCAVLCGAVRCCAVLCGAVEPQASAAHLDERDGTAALGHARHLGADPAQELPRGLQHRASVNSSWRRCRRTGGLGTLGRAGERRHPHHLVRQHKDEQGGTLNRVRQVGVGDHVVRELDALPNGEPTA